MKDYEKIGQMLYLGYKEKDFSKFIKLLGDIPVGGIIFFEENFTSSSYIKVIEKVKKEQKLPVFIGLDQEGGRVQRLKSVDEKYSLPSMRELANKFKPHEVEHLANELGKDLVELGLNLNFAPVLDLSINESEIIGDRSFGEDPENVTNYALSYYKGLRSAGIVSVGKHFPNHCLVTEDSHKILPVSEYTMESNEFIKSLIPFRSNIDERIPGIMLAHIKFPKIDISSNLPCSISSKFIKEILKGNLKFSGFTITDDLLMDAIKNEYSISEAAIIGISNGIDMVMLSGSIEMQFEVFHDLLVKLNNNFIKGDRISEALARISSVKGEYL